MIRLWDRLLGRAPARNLGGVDSTYSTWMSLYGMPDAERILPSYTQYAAEAYSGNAVIFSLVQKRVALFSEATFKWRNLGDKHLYGDSDLRKLEQPWPNGSTGELLARMEQDVSLAGNAYIRDAGDRLERLRPDWVTIISHVTTDALGRKVREVVGYLYEPVGDGSRDAELYLVDEVAHWSPIPDPLANFRGMSWLTPVLREIDADIRQTAFRDAYFRNAATPNVILKYQQRLGKDRIERLRDMMQARHTGPDNAFGTLVLDEGADLTIAGSNMEGSAFPALQSAGETRMAAAAGVPASVAGLAASVQNARPGTYEDGMRSFADLTMRPNWRTACAALSTIVQVPADAQLWYDVRDISALHPGEKDAVANMAAQAGTARQLIDAGYDPDSVTGAISAGDVTLLKHSGMTSVQLYKPGAAGGNSSATPDAPPPDAGTGTGTGGGAKPGKGGAGRGRRRRAFDPAEQRDPHGKWSKAGHIKSLIDKLKQAGGSDGVYFDDDHYLDWSPGAKHGIRTLEVGDGQDTLTADVSVDDLHELHDDLAASLAGNVSGGYGNEHGVTFDYTPLDVHGESWSFQVTAADGETLEFEWPRHRLVQLHNALTTTLIDEAVNGPDAGRGRRAATVAPGEELKHYWTHDPEGLAKWVDHPHPWTALYTELVKHVEPAEAKRIAAQWYHDVLGHWPGDKQPGGHRSTSVRAGVQTAAMVALVPSPQDAARLATDGGEPVDELHLTLLFLGDAAGYDDGAQARIVDALRRVVDDVLVPDFDLPITADGFSVAVFNPDGQAPCVVLGVTGAELQPVHDLVDAVAAGLAAAGGFTVPEQHSPWAPHVTLAYTDDAGVVAQLTDRVGPITFDRLRVAFAGAATDIPLAAPAGGRSARNFDPLEPRDPHGKWSKAGGLVHKLDDKLKLAGKAHLGEGETLAGSDVVEGSDSIIPMAWVHGPGGTKLRLGTGILFEDRGRWRAADRGHTVVLDPGGVSQLRTAVDQMKTAGADASAKAHDLDRQQQQLQRRQRELIRRQFPNLTKAQAKELDRIDGQIQGHESRIASLEAAQRAAIAELSPAGQANWARIDAEVERLSGQKRHLYDRFWADGGKDWSILGETKKIDLQIESLLEEQIRLHDEREKPGGHVRVGFAHLFKGRRDEIVGLTRDLDAARARRQELTGTAVALSEADTAELAAVTARAAAIEQELFDLVDGTVVAHGIIPAEWGDLAFEARMTDALQPDFSVAVRPRHARHDWSIDGDTETRLDPAQLDQLARAVARGPGPVG